MLNQVAQEIAAEASEITGFEVSITDAQGIITGASDPARRGMLHEPSIKCLATLSVCITDSHEASGYAAVKPGVTVPVIVNGQPLGTLTMAGPPEEVARYGRLVQSQAQIMLRERSMAESAMERERALRELARQIGSFDPARSDPAFLSARARELGYDLWLYKNVAVCAFYPYASGTSVRYALAAVRCAQDTFSTPSDMIVPMEDSRVAIITQMAGAKFARAVEWYMEKLQDAGGCALIGTGHEAASLRQLPQAWGGAWEAVTVAERLSLQCGIYNIDHFAAEAALLSAGPARLEALSKSLPILPDELARTFEAWCESPSQPGRVAQAMHVHRNTLSYRLEKIREITGLDVHNMHHAFRLYMVTLARKFLHTP